MSGHGGTGDDQPDLVAEARFWREWNTAVFERDHSHEEAASIAARLSPDPDRLEAILARADTSSALRRPAAQADSDDQLIQIHADAGRFFQSQLEGSWVPGYLADRGLDAVFLPGSPWRIGYAPGSWTALTKHLRGLGYTDDTMLKSGLVAEGKYGLHDRFRDRLMIPLRRAADRVAVGFIGRRSPAADADRPADGEDDRRPPKYLNSPNTELYTKGHVLLGLAEGHSQLKQGAQPVLVEGPMDAIAVSIAAPGRFAGVAPCGTALTPAQAAELARATDLSERGVRVALDPDSAGRKAAVKAYAQLSEVAESITTVSLPDGIDPSGMLETQGPDSLRAALTDDARPLVDMVIDARIEAWELGSVEAQFAALRAIGEVVATMPPREAAREMGRVTDMFTTRYHWKSGDVTMEIIDAVERHLFGPVGAESAPLPWERASGLLPEDTSGGFPPQTVAAIANGIAPYNKACGKDFHSSLQDISARVRGRAQDSADERR